MPLTRFRTRWFDLLLLAVLAITGFRLWQSFGPKQDFVSAPPDRMFQGSAMKLPLPTGGARTLVLFVSARCAVCTSNLAFYAQLANWVSNHPDVSMIIAGPETETELRDWLATGGVEAKNLMPKTDLSAEGVAFVPTTVIVERGIVTDIVTRQLKEKEREALFDRLSGKGETLNVTGYAPTVRESDFRRSPPADAILVDVRPRNASTNPEAGMHIPYDEFKERGVNELPVNREVIIDCRRGRLGWCDTAAEALLEKNRTNVKLLVRDR